MTAPTQFLQVDGTDIAVSHDDGDTPGLVWLGGYRSDMAGTKALEMHGLGIERGLMATRFDYSGHGESKGAFREGTISLWLSQARAVFEAFTKGPQILVGSSMGAWIALRMVQELNQPNKGGPIAGLLLLAPAPDFTKELMEPELTESQRRDLDEQGYYEEPTPYGPDPNIFTKALFDDARNNLVMTGPIDTYCPVHIIQGQADPDVPWQHAARLYELLPKDDVTITFVKDGDHRLSRPQDIETIKRLTNALIDQVRGA